MRQAQERVDARLVEAQHVVAVDVQLVTLAVMIPPWLTHACMGI
jgi:hypothetical protein